MAAGGGGSSERGKCVECLRQLSHQLSTESDSSEELSLLQNVYLDDLQVTREDDDTDSAAAGITILVHVTPSTGEDVTKKYIYLNLHLHLSPEYPTIPPKISIPTSRGLSDDHLRSMKERLLVQAAALTGYPMVYELVEYAKDSLTANNLPCGECTLCLYTFHDGDDFTKTDCFHYFHVTCLARYYQFFTRKQEPEATPTTEPRPHKPMLECPVCRDPIAPEATCLEAVLQATPPQTSVEEKGEIFISDQVRSWQKEMARLLQQQEERGGVIDPTAKDDVIDETWVRPLPPPSEQSDVNPEERGHEMAPGKKESRHHRYRYNHSNHSGRQQGKKGGQKERGQGGQRGQESGQGGQRGQERGQGGQRGQERGQGGQRGQERGQGGQRGQESGQGGQRGQERGQGGQRGQERGQGGQRGQESGQGGERSRRTEGAGERSGRTEEKEN